MVFAFFALEDYFSDHPNIETNLYYAELVILGIFIIEITLHFIGYRMMYFADLWNIFDTVVILLSIVFVLLDLQVDEKSSLSGFLKIRGIFRLLRIFLLVRKLN